MRHDHGETTVICIPLGWTMPERFKHLVASGIVSRVAPEKIASCLELMRSGRVHILNVPPLTVYYELNALIKRLSIERNAYMGLG